MSTIRVATWNIRKAVGLDRRRDPSRVLSVIAEIGADVVALQEADRRLGRRPSALPRERIEEATGLVPVDTSNGPSLGHHGNAILVSRDFDVDDVARLDLPGFEPRGALMVDLRKDDSRIRLVALHLGLARRHRRRQLAAIRAEIEARDARPTLILGDFNEWSPDRGLEELGEEYLVHSPGRTYHASRPVAPLDRIAHCTSWQLTGAGVTETALSRMASDHLPVWATLAPAAV